MAPVSSPWLNLPDGYLPKWMIFIAVVSLFNSIQAYTTTSYTRRVYSASPASVTTLSARTFGTWTALTAIVRLFAAFHITEPAWYQLAFLTYVVAALHFVSEWVVFRSANLGAGLTGPLIVSSATMTWMWWVWQDYVGGSIFMS
ncbi:MAG: ergosterol biosynthesis protein [Alyxoria varia]|nr:MAG: ergosterol biosynthesis protein [Alyxoria varia]